MPTTRWNVDHQHQILSPDVAVAPGDAYEFDDDEAVAGLWSDTDPRAGLPAERDFKRRRDAVPEPQDAEPSIEPPAEPDDTPEGK